MKLAALSLLTLAAFARPQSASPPAPGEIAAVKDRLNAFNLGMAAWRVPSLGPREGAARKQFEFTRNIGVGTITAERIQEGPLVDKLANEYSINVAVCGAPASILAAVNAFSKRIGICTDAATVQPDADYAVSWIRGYGKGRVFFCILGHNPTIFTTPDLARFFLAGIQFILGDLDADTAPSGKLH